MHNTTVRGALRGTTATLAFCAALSSGAAVASAAPLRLEPATETTTAPVAEEYTSSGSSTISASVNAKIACLFFAGNLAC
ncbi:hypothetical protein ABZ894_15625 [Nocardia beijingensis]|uniref:Uncharacterized protein n=1 Tax=Nocardia beijingensis TaxID=95162 RepID=A0ABW7WCP1_9NOCA|nr:hypothetical protein [Nocardia beijingensis]MBF6073290.1 hypothetical protein [Nocardia beijingensis]